MKSQQPIAVVATSFPHFREICKMHGWSWSRIRYIPIERVEEFSAGLYAEDIYPPEYGRFRPSREVID